MLREGTCAYFTMKARKDAKENKDFTRWRNAAGKRESVTLEDVVGSSFRIFDNALLVIYLFILPEFTVYNPSLIR